MNECMHEWMNDRMKEWMKWHENKMSWIYMQIKEECMTWHDIGMKMKWNQHGMTWNYETWMRKFNKRPTYLIKRNGTEMAWHDMAWHGMTWHEITWNCMAWHGTNWYGMTWNHMTWQAHETIWNGMPSMNECNEIAWN